MKKLLLVLLVALLALTGCSTPTEEPTEEKISFGLVTDVGGINDKSFNQSTWEGAVRWAEENGLVEGEDYKYLVSKTDADYDPNLSAFSDDEVDLIIAPGFLFLNTLTDVAARYPDQKYLFIDEVLDAPNVSSAKFAVEQGSFLVGVIAGETAKASGATAVGYVGGMDFPSIQQFEAGYEAGVKAVYPECEIYVDYVGDFFSAEVGKTLAAKQYNAGAAVVYQVAGDAGNGVIAEAKERRLAGDDVWAIGVDKDQYEIGIYEGEKSAVLTSMLKRVDNASYDHLEMIKNGTFVGGEIVNYTLADNGVGIPEENPNVPQEILDIVAGYSDQIVSGDLVVPMLPTRVEAK